MDNQTIVTLMGLASLGLIVLLSLALYLWYFKLGGKKALETN
ncbi:hypothetical protein [Methanocaldococcus jannaschii]|nr:hypothetical protein [Methanocaldococcus jannaschii]